MNEKIFRQIAREMVASYSNDKHPDKLVTVGDVYVVWCCKTLQNNKAMLSTDVPDGRYYEITYNGDKQEFYFDAYVKEHNQCFAE